MKKTKKEIKVLPEKKVSPNIELNESYLKAFDHFNKKLFSGTLGRPMLCFTRNSNVIGGYFSPNKWYNENGRRVHEIAINANHMKGGDIPFLMGILIHEMVHLWQNDYGKPTRNGYHNYQWIQKAMAVGLVCEADDGGVDVPGQNIHTEFRPNDWAMKATASLPDEAIFPWLSVPLNPEPPQPKGGDGKEKSKDKETGKGGKRSKYTCPACGLNAWAKPGVKLSCLTCNQVLVESKV